MKADRAKLENELHKCQDSRPRLGILNESTVFWKGFLYIVIRMLPSPRTAASSNTMRVIEFVKGLENANGSTVDFDALQKLLDETFLKWRTLDNFQQTAKFGFVTTENEVDVKKRYLPYYGSCVVYRVRVNGPTAFASTYETRVSLFYYYYFSLC